MRSLLVPMVVPLVLLAQADPAREAYKSWDAQHPWTDQNERADSLFKNSAEWVVKWPDSKLAWDQRREALVLTRNQSPELWKQVGENLIRLNPPHSFARLVASDWVAAKVNLKEAEELLTGEIDWLNQQPPHSRPADPTLADLIDEADLALRPFGALCSLVSVETQLKEFDRAHKRMAQIRQMLDGDFKRYYDQDPLEAFPDYGAKDPILSAQLAQAEGRGADALAFYQQVIANPYFHREYEKGQVEHAHSLWKEIGGTEEGWAVFSWVPSLPPGVPRGMPGLAFLPWHALNFRLPEMKVPGLDSRVWNEQGFRG